VDFSSSFHLWKKIYVFSTVPSVLFSPKLFMLNCALFCDSSLLIMSAKDKKSEIFSYFNKGKCEFPSRSHTISLNKGLLNTHSHFANVCVSKEHMGVDYAFCALCMVWPGSTVSLNRQGCNRQSMQRVQNTWSIRTGLCLNARTQIEFSKQPFSWFWSLEITKGPQTLAAKSTTAFPEIVYITVILSYVSASNCSLNRLNLWLLFFRRFTHGNSAACEQLPY